MRVRSLWKLFAIFAVVNLLVVGWSLAHRPSHELRVTFLDVGQGDAAVIESPSGKVLLVDTGGLIHDGEDDEGRRTVAPFLRARGINRIDAIVLTHPHADHIGGAASLIDRFPVGLLMDNAQDSASQVVTRYLTAANDHDVRYSMARRGQRLDFGDGVIAQVVAPTEAETAGTPNNASVVLRLTYGRAAFLLTGDAEAEEEQELLSSGQPIGCDVLKVGHHGSHTSTTPEFLAAAHPRVAIISVGAHNLYGHPSGEVLDRLQLSGARVFRTDRSGAVTCISDGVTVHTEPMRAFPSAR